jgi:hypothetical protein
MMNQGVRIPALPATLDGNLNLPVGASALVLFAHGSGSGRRSPRNRFVARTLNEDGLATLLFDLLTREEEAVDLHTAQHRFDVGLLAERLVHATLWATGRGRVSPGGRRPPLAVEEGGLQVGLAAVYRYQKKAGARLKVPGPCHRKKDAWASEALREALAVHLGGRPGQTSACEPLRKTRKSFSEMGCTSRKGI